MRIKEVAAHEGFPSPGDLPCHNVINVSKKKTSKQKNKKRRWFGERPCLDPALAVIERLCQQNEFFKTHAPPKKIKGIPKLYFQT